MRARTSHLVVVVVVIVGSTSGCDEAAPPGGSVEIVNGPAPLSSTSEATFVLGCENAGCEIECALDDEDFASCGTTVTYTGVADGAHRFAARTTSDPTQATAMWTVDTVAPVVSISAAPATITNVAAGTLEFSCSETGCTLECTLDGVLASTCGSPWQLAPLADGDHVASVRGRDAAGNIGDAVAMWRVDTVAPTASFVTAPGDPTNATVSMHTLACNEPPCTFTCSRDSAPYTACTSSVIQGGTADGEHRLDVRATDAAGNTGAAVTDTWVVDTVRPTVSITSGPPALTNQSSAQLVLASTEPGIFQCNRDGAGFAPCSSPVMYTGFSTGAHTVVVRVIDAAQNVSTPVTHAWTVDVTPPIVTIVSAPLATTQYPDARLVFTANETGSTFECQADGSGFAPCASPAVFPGLSSSAHTIAVRAIDPAGNPSTPASRSFTVDPALDVIYVGGGARHTCAIRSDRSLWCFGDNSDRAVGDGTTMNRPTPTRIGTATTWATVTGGFDHTCGTRTDGTAWCWGKNATGQLGDGTTTNRAVPTQIPGTTWASLALGDDHSCGLQTDGTLWCWGTNTQGQFGNGATGMSSTPVQIGTATWTSLVAGGNHTCGLQGTTLYCWGSNFSGTLGDGTQTTRRVPTQIMTGIASVSAGEYYNCAVDTAGGLWCWGSNFWGSVGDGTFTDRVLPTSVAGTWSSVSAQGFHVCGTQIDGTTWCWGANPDGQLGLGFQSATQEGLPTPQRIVQPTGLAFGDGSGNHTFALRADGTLWTWGWASHGQLGSGETMLRTVPTPSLL